MRNYMILYLYVLPFVGNFISLWISATITVRMVYTTSFGERVIYLSKAFLDGFFRSNLHKCEVLLLHVSAFWGSWFKQNVDFDSACFQREYGLCKSVERGIEHCMYLPFPYTKIKGFVLRIKIRLTKQYTIRVSNTPYHIVLIYNCICLDMDLIFSSS